MQSVVIVTGPPGAGKSTVARLLAESAPAPGGVHLHGDDFLGYIRSGFVEPWRPESMAQNVTLTRALARAATAFAAGGYFTALDWIVGPWFLGEWRAVAREANIALDYVVLRPSLETVTFRARDRPDMPVPDYAHLLPLYEQLSDLDELEHHALDTSALTIDETVDAVRSGLAAGRYRLT
jgi:hypothetical protein